MSPDLLPTLSFKWGLALIILILTVVTGLWPFLSRKNIRTFSLLESFANGIFLGAALLHMLPDSVRMFASAGYQYPYPFLIAGSMFLCLLFIERFSSPLSRKITFLSALMLSIHSLFEGIALGVAMDFSTTLIIFIAIVAHKGTASLAFSTQLNKSTLPLRSLTLTFLLFTLMTPAGILLGSSLLKTQDPFLFLLAPTFNAMAAGTFLYIGTLHGLEQSPLIKHAGQFINFAGLSLGFALMSVVAVWA